MNNKYGLICVCNTLKEEDPSNAFQGMTRKEFTQIVSKSDEASALKQLEDQILHNLTLTCKIIEFCRANHIDHYRLNQSIFGIAEDSSVDIDLRKLPRFDEITENIHQVGVSAISNMVSLSIQPDIFCKLNDDDEKIVENSISELNFYGWFLDTIGVQKNYSSPIICSVGNQPASDSHDDIIQFVESFIEKFNELDESVQKRLSFKNDDAGAWSSLTLFKYFHVYCREKFGNGMALSYDNLHDLCNPSYIEKELVDPNVNVGAYHETWGGVVPVFTWSEAMEPGSKKHSVEYSAPIPDFNYQIKWECDAQSRDKAILKLLTPTEEFKITEEMLKTMTRKKYTDASDYYNKLYQRSK